MALLVPIVLGLFSAGLLPAICGTFAIILVMQLGCQWNEKEVILCHLIFFGLQDYDTRNTYRQEKNKCTHPKFTFPAKNNSKEQDTEELATASKPPPAPRKLNIAHSRCQPEPGNPQ